MTTRSHRASAGFSLLELVVVVGILTIVTGAAFQLMTSSQVSFDRNNILAEAHQNADFAVLRVTELVRGAGSNPGGSSTVNSLKFISNKETDTSPADPHVVRIQSDLNGNKTIVDRASSVNPTSAQYFVISSEDMTVKFFPTATRVGGVDVPEHSICLIDNTPGDGQGAPRLLAQNIVDFSCPVVGTNAREVTLTITAGPSRGIEPTNSRYASFTRVMQVRLRNRS